MKLRIVELFTDHHRTVCNLVKGNKNGDIKATVYNRADAKRFSKAINNSGEYRDLLKRWARNMKQTRYRTQDERLLLRDTRILLK